MSANNWTQCPRCKVTNDRIAEEKHRAASEAYGKVSPEQFDALREDARQFRKEISINDSFCATLREDWDIGILNGKFFAYYGAECITCGFIFSYKHEEKIVTGDDNLTPVEGK